MRSTARADRLTAVAVLAITAAAITVALYVAGVVNPPAPQAPASAPIRPMPAGAAPPMPNGAVDLTRVPLNPYAHVIPMKDRGARA